MFYSRHFWTVWLVPHVFVILFLLYYDLHWAPTLISFGVSYCLISGLGIAVGFHRYFSHGAFQTNRLWQQLMLICGCLACHGHPLFWVALHRGGHHRWSDTEKDPHSPSAGIWHAYQGYAFDPRVIAAISLKSASSFMRHKEWQWVVPNYHTIVNVGWLITGLVSIWWPSVAFGFVCAQVWAIHQEAVVNVLGHTRGFGAYVNYATRDRSVNRPLLGLFTWGQALHNNHHGDPANPNFGSVKWWELDPSMLWIQLIRNDK